MHKWTYDEYLLLPEDGRRYEAIDGALYVDGQLASAKHQRALRVEIAVAAHFADDVLWCLRTDALFAHLGNEPDIIFKVEEPPGLAFEILGAARIADEEKRRLYERSAIEEYWVFDPDRETAAIYRRDGNGYELAAEVRDRLTTALLPGLEIDLACIFRG